MSAKSVILVCLTPLLVATGCRTTPSKAKATHSTDSLVTPVGSYKATFVEPIGRAETDTLLGIWTSPFDESLSTLRSGWHGPAYKDAKTFPPWYRVRHAYLAEVLPDVSFYITPFFLWESSWWITPFARYSGKLYRMPYELNALARDCGLGLSDSSVVALARALTVFKAAAASLGHGELGGRFYRSDLFREIEAGRHPYVPAFTITDVKVDTTLLVEARTPAHKGYDTALAREYDTAFAREVAHSESLPHMSDVMGPFVSEDTMAFKHHVTPGHVQEVKVYYRTGGHDDSLVLTMADGRDEHGGYMVFPVYVDRAPILDLPRHVRVVDRSLIHALEMDRGGIEITE